jgi:uncharacterized membrane protein
MAYSGKYKPTNPKKYIGDPTKIIYRSSWERKMMRYFDASFAVLKWSSEEIQIPYFSPRYNQIRKYFPDFVIYAKTKDDKTKIIMIEVKPQRQTIPPKVPKRKTKKYFAECMVYAVNIAKWKAAAAFCKAKGWEWRIMTENDIYK